MAKLHIFGGGAPAATLLDWLAREAGIRASEIASIVDEPEALARETSGPRDIPRVAVADLEGAVAEDDIVIVVTPASDKAVATLFERGRRNVYDGNAIIRRESAADRFRRVASAFHMGPTPAIDDEAEARKYQRYSDPPLAPGRVPRHKLFVVNSMPKSGTVWVMAMLEALLGIKSQEQLCLSHVGEIEHVWKKPNVHGGVTLVRDMRGVVLSWFHHVQRADLQFGYAAPRYPTVEDFYQHYFVGLLCGTERYYCGDLERWLNFIGAHNLPLLRYEDLATDTAAGLKKISNFWRLEVGDQRIGEIARDYAFDAMQATVSGRPGFVADTLKTGHLRRGEPNAWREEVPDAVARDIDARFAGYQRRLGYTP